MIKEVLHTIYYYWQFYLLFIGIFSFGIGWAIAPMLLYEVHWSLSIVGVLLTVKGLYDIK